MFPLRLDLTFRIRLRLRHTHELMRRCRDDPGDQHLPCKATGPLVKNPPLRKATPPLIMLPIAVLLPSGTQHHRYRDLLLRCQIAGLLPLAYPSLSLTLVCVQVANEATC